MPDDKFRRSLALPRRRESDVKAIKDAQGMKTDTAAIDDAIAFRARFANRRADEIQTALSLFDEVKRECQPGCAKRVVVENPAQPSERTVFVMP
jgi:hypothetical protein